jgi:hypothetical protein
MSGFSQGSYDRIHGFDFGRVRENIETMVSNCRECGFAGRAEILFHVYQFNVDEIEPAREFAESLGIGFTPYMAYFAGYLMMRSYLVGEMPYEELKRASSELFLFYVEGRRKEAPAGYRCPQFDFLTLDEECRVVTCCALEKEAPDYLIGDLFELPPERIRRMKESRRVCAECGRLGINYLFHNPYLLSPGRPAGGARR